MARVFTCPVCQKDVTEDAFATDPRVFQAQCDLHMAIKHGIPADKYQAKPAAVRKPA